MKVGHDGWWVGREDCRGKQSLPPEFHGETTKHKTLIETRCVCDIVTNPLTV